MNLAPPAPLEAGAVATPDGWRGALEHGARAVWRSLARWRRPGLLPVAAGGLALLAAAGLSLLLVPRWQADTRAAGLALHQRAASARPAAAGQAPAPGPARRLHAALPAAGQTPLRVAELLALAQRHDIAVGSARQSPASGGEGGALPAMVAAPVARTAPAAAMLTRPPLSAAVPLAWRAQGRYADLRAFVAAALQADPGLVLEQLRLSRADGRSAVLDADLQWQLLLQAEPAALPPAASPAPPSSTGPRR